MMQFGHNDGAVDKPGRYVNIAGYKEYLRLFVDQTREKGAIPVIYEALTQLNNSTNKK